LGRYLLLHEEHLGVVRERQSIEEGLMVIYFEPAVGF